jgi:acid phosphatase family membrane protein YuiD
MKTWVYVAVPFLTWLIVGLLKFILNSVKEKKIAFDLVGYGGMPSNHSAIVSSIATAIACREGIDTPEFGVAIAMVFIVIMDANSLRGAVGRHAAAINQLSGGLIALRERMGHTKIEILVGLFIGALIGFAFVNLEIMI